MLAAEVLPVHAVTGLVRAQALPRQIRHSMVYPAGPTAAAASPTAAVVAVGALVALRLPPPPQRSPPASCPPAPCGS